MEMYMCSFEEGVGAFEEGLQSPSQGGASSFELAVVVISEFLAKQVVTGTCTAFVLWPW
jgi:hypothetical protein